MISFVDIRTRRVVHRRRFDGLVQSYARLPHGLAMLVTPADAIGRARMVVSDADAARAQLVERGVEVSDVQDFPWGRFVFFADPDGNRWAVQEIVTQG